MPILKQTPLPLSDMKKYIEKSEEKKPIEDYLKKFSKSPKGKVSDFIKEIKELNNPKIRDNDVIKIIDFLPSNSEEVNKLFSEQSLNEEEVNKILEIIKEYT